MGGISGIRFSQIQNFLAVKAGEDRELTIGRPAGKKTKTVELYAVKTANAGENTDVRKAVLEGLTNAAFHDKSKSVKASYFAHGETRTIVLTGKDLQKAAIEGRAALEDYLNGSAEALTIRDIRVLMKSIQSLALETKLGTIPHPPMPSLGDRNIRKSNGGKAKVKPATVKTSDLNIRIPTPPKKRPVEVKTSDLNIRIPTPPKKRPVPAKGSAPKSPAPFKGKPSRGSSMPQMPKRVKGSK